MTDSYNAGEIVITAKLDTSGLRHEFAALQFSANKAGVDAGKNLGAQFGANMASGFKAGQFGKRVNDALANELEPVADGLAGKFLGLFKRRLASNDNKLGAKAAKVVEVNFGKSADRVGGKFRSVFSKVGGGLAGVLKGGLVGLGLEALNFGINLYKNSIEQAKREQEEFNQKLLDADQFVSTYSKRLEDANKRLNGVSNVTEAAVPHILNYKSNVDQLAASFQTIGKLSSDSNFMKFSDPGILGLLGKVQKGIGTHKDSVDDLRHGYDNLEEAVAGAAAQNRSAAFKDAISAALPLLADMAEKHEEIARLRKQSNHGNHSPNISVGLKIDALESSVEKTLKPKIKEIAKKLFDFIRLPDEALDNGLSASSQKLDHKNKLLIAAAGNQKEVVQGLQDEALEQAKVLEFIKLKGLLLGTAKKEAASFMVDLRATRAERERELAIQERQLTLAKQKKSVLNDELAVARANGDQIAVRALEDQLLLEQKLAEYKDAKFKDYETRAQKYLEDMQAARSEADKLKRDNLDYQSRIEIATAAGDETEVNRLEDQQREVELTATYESAGYDPTMANQMAQDRMAAVEAANLERLAREELIALEQRHLALSERDLQLALEKAQYGENHVNNELFYHL